jgi:pimeloyl-ACP methyl ester carboxylesterase
MNSRMTIRVGAGCCLAAALLAGCASRPIGADQVSTRLAYAQVTADAVSSAKPSAATVSLLHRYDLDRLAAQDAPKALLTLHEKALATGERDLLFALAELSYTAGEQVRHCLKAWDKRDARDFYLGSAVYAYLFLFGEAKGTKPDAFDRRFRTACDLYNYGLGWALSERRGTNSVARLEGGRRQLPVGEIDVRLDSSAFPWSLDRFDRFLVADHFRVRGLSVRNREAGVGAPLIAFSQTDPNLRLQRATAATVFLRVQGSLAEVAAAKGSAALELYSAFETSAVRIGEAKVPLELDLTTPSAYVLNQSFAWEVGRRQFFAPVKGLRSQLILTQPYEPGRVPVVLVHGTFSSPIWWGEMLNTLKADPELRRRCQFWLFLYSSSKPVMLSAMELRDELSATVKGLDPEGRDPALQQMVVIGHSQGGLLTKLTATDTGDKLWRALSDKPLAELKLNDEQRALLQKTMFVEPLPFVRRVVFISTPHRGSYLSTSLARKLARMAISLPGALTERTTELLFQNQDVKLPGTFHGKMPNSLDGMSPKNPVLLELANIPVAPSVTAHSIIPVLGKGDYRKGKDGVVAYSSAHVDYVESELIVRDAHSCQDKPPTIEEVRRILHKHLSHAGLPGPGPSPQ